ncbi:MAG: glycosyltransferase [Candidatus Cloacimonetes bacterium]|jgi:glycosyltransferase involved in cell wall biosynthesis|nr:glycosyltransferase [Candidatus Cloacimonadota bacterium]MDD2506947.1 glycosyltransferase [Candidatus Cloacimonadota bacterium]MDD4560572.1 glycosyltransferase [Candidatus Cloacimonadota bacterium]
MKKRILHLQLLPLLSGAQRFSLHLLDGLPADEYEIYVAAKPGREFEDAVLERGWKFLPVSSFRHRISVWDIAAFFDILSIMRRYHFDIVHTNSSKPGILGRLAARVAGVKRIVHTAHGTAFQDSQPVLVKSFYMMMEKLGNALGDYTVFVNNVDRIRCVALGLIPESKAKSIYNAIAEGANPVPDRVKHTDDSITIGSTIRFSDQKNVLALVIAACKACIREQRLRFILLGDGEHYSLCRSIVASHRLSDRILLPGWDSQVQPWLAVFDAFILYSRWEAMPYSIIEAMQAGLPVIGSDIPSISELVVTESGWLVPLDDEESLVSKLVEIAANPEEIVQKGRYAQQYIRRVCNYDAMIRDYRAIYERRGA